MMINYEILGMVTARSGSQSLALSSQQQLLLARLVCAKGAAVTQRELVRAVWDQGRVPDGGLKSAIYELRSSLRKVLGAEDILVHGGDAYRLLLDGQQVDAFRFAARLEQAGTSADPEASQLAQKALDEWGPRASGLFGGYPLLGLDGSWAHRTRRMLRAQYRNAVMDSLRRDADAEDWESLLRRCGQLAVQDQEDPDRKDPQEAMADIGFLELWMLAAHRSGQPDLADQVLRRATEIAARSGGPVKDDLRRLAQRLRDEAYPMSPASNGRAKSEPVINFNNNAGSVVNGQMGVVNGDANFYVGDSSAPPEERIENVMVARASDGSRVNQAGRDQTVTGS